jgi:hypothetical protein
VYFNKLLDKLYKMQLHKKLEKSSWQNCFLCYIKVIIRSEHDKI